MIRAVVMIEKACKHTGAVVALEIVVLQWRSWWVGLDIQTYTYGQKNILLYMVHMYT
jgi:hypothetical protein